MSDAPVTAQSETAYTRSASGTYVILLAVLIGFNAMDRQIFSIIAEPVKHEFSLSDTQLGVLTGAIFAVVFAVASIPLAWMADRVSRTAILALCAATWSLCTMAMGLTTGFTTLAIARVGLAVGEAGCNPCAQSLIADYVPGERRNRAMGIYILGGIVGLVAAGIFGGKLNDLYGWRVALLVLGGGSLLFALVTTLVLPEPPRKTDSSSKASNSDFRRLLRKPGFRYLLAISALGGISGWGLLAWGNILVVRLFGWTPGQAGATSGVIVGVATILGIAIGTPLAERLVRRDLRWQLWMQGLSHIFLPLTGMFIYFGQTAWMCLGAVGIQVFISSLPAAPSTAAIQRYAPDSTRARAAALTGATASLVGMGVGPVLVGAISDALAPSLGANSLRYGLAVLIIFQALNAWCAFKAAETVHQDFED